MKEPNEIAREKSKFHLQVFTLLVLVVVPIFSFYGIQIARVHQYKYWAQKKAYPEKMDAWIDRGRRGKEPLEPRNEGWDNVECSLDILLMACFALGAVAALGCIVGMTFEAFMAGIFMWATYHITKSPEK